MIVNADEKAIEQAAKILSEAGLVAFPTETVYGLGADARSDEAVGKIFKLKKRPAFNPLIVHLAAVEKIYEICSPLELKTQKQFERLALLWPGPLTLVLPLKRVVSSLASAGLSSVAVRIPLHHVALQLLKKVDFPIAAPSANIASTVSPTRAIHVEESFGVDAPFILDGGPCQIGLESTIVSLLGPTPTVLRHGGVTLETLQELLGDFCEITVSASSSAAEASRSPAPNSVSSLISPGQLAKHYAPKTPLIWLEGGEFAHLKGQRLGFLSLSGKAPPLPCVREVYLSPSGKMEEIAANLFDGLRTLDAQNLDAIVVEKCPEVGLGRAVMDRLQRASTTEE